MEEGIAPVDLLYRKSLCSFLPCRNEFALHVVPVPSLAHRRRFPEILVHRMDVDDFHA